MRPEPPFPQSPGTVQRFAVGLCAENPRAASEHDRGGARDESRRHGNG